MARKKLPIKYTGKHKLKNGKFVVDTLRVLPSLIVINSAGKQLSYVLDQEPMTKEAYQKFQKDMEGSLQVTVSMRVVAK